MPVKSPAGFIDLLSGSPQLLMELRAITDPCEIVKLGHRCGFSFDMDSFLASLATAGPKVAELFGSGTPCGGPGRESTWHHYEFDVDQNKDLSGVSEALDALKVKPRAVDLDAFSESFRPEDLAWTDMSPDAEPFQERYREVMAAHWDKSRPEYVRRDFHLVNLDRYVDDAMYDRYFRAKVQMLAVLEEFFGTAVRFSGSLWYPPSSYRLWHTNETQPGWRMYLIDFDSDYDWATGRSFFRYMNPDSNEVVTLEEHPRMMRFFKIEQDPAKLFWHCIVNASSYNRWSFGFEIPEDALARLGV